MFTSLSSLKVLLDCEAQHLFFEPATREHRSAAKPTEGSLTPRIVVDGTLSIDETQPASFHFEIGRKVARTPRGGRSHRREWEFGAQSARLCVGTACSRSI